MKFGFDWPYYRLAVSEKKMFGYYGHIHVHVYSPGVGADNPPGVKIFHKTLIFCPFAYSQ